MQVVAGAGGGDEFDYDPDWDGDWDIDRSLLDDDDDDGSMGLGGGWDGVQVDTKALSVVPASDEEVTELTKDWVEAGERTTKPILGPSLKQCPVAQIDFVTGPPHWTGYPYLSP